MNIDSLQSLYINNIHNIFTAKNFAELASHSNEIQGYSFINRTLIFLQNRCCSDVRSEASWNTVQRIIKDGSIPIGVLTPIIKNSYTDAVSGEPISSKELSINEFNKAIELGVINKSSEIIDVKATLVYDIRDTEVMSSDNKINTTRKIKMSTILNMLNSFGIVIAKIEDGETTFDKETNTLNFGNDDIANKVRVCMDALAIIYIEQMQENTDLSENEIRVIREYSKYSVITYFGLADSQDASFDYLDELNSKLDEDSINRLVGLLDGMEDILNQNVFGTDSSDNNASEEHKSYIARRAAILLNILEANYSAHND